MASRCMVLLLSMILVVAGIVAGVTAGSGLTGQAATPRTGDLLVDLGRDLVAITTGFTGSEVLLFGVKDQPGDIIVRATGPAAEVVVRRKSRVAGIWINRDSVRFAGVPGYYFLAATRPPAALLPAGTRRATGIGAAFLQPAAIDATVSRAEIEGFRQGMVRNRVAQGLFLPDVAPVTMVHDRLFHVRVPFPANVPTGIYDIEVFSVAGGQITARARTRLQIGKVGFEARVFDFARNSPALYGAVAILVALAAGWITGIAFRKA